MRPVREFMADRLSIGIYRTRQDLGAAASLAVAQKLRELLDCQKRVCILFASAPSQNEFLAELSAASGIDWSRVTAMHLDEYLGLSADAPQAFGTYLRHHLLERVKPGQVHYLEGNAISPEEECRRYADLLRESPPDIACMGIGENGHLAFNDPEIADFADPVRVKVVKLSEQCRLQQVHEGCFPVLDQVPTHALTLTIPALISPRWLYCMVPGPTKRDAVKTALEGNVSRECPASILRTHGQASLFLDVDSAALLKALDGMRSKS